MSVFDHPEFDQHESVHYVHDAATGLQAIICIHSTALGPAAGGCRHWQYASDDMALEVINVALAKGIRVPEELSVIGFDDNPIAATARVPLTTIRQPLADMGRRGMELLIQQVQGKGTSPKKVLLPTELVERSSCRQTWLER